MLFAIAEASKSGGKSFYWYSIPEILVLDLIHNLWIINELYKKHDKFWNTGSIYVTFGTYVQTVIKGFTSCERRLGMVKFPVKFSSGQKKLKLNIISKWYLIWHWLPIWEHGNVARTWKASYTHFFYKKVIRRVRAKLS